MAPASDRGDGVEHLTEEEIAEGFAAIQAAAEEGGNSGPIEDDCDLLVLEAVGGRD